MVILNSVKVIPRAHDVIPEACNAIFGARDASQVDLITGAPIGGAPDGMPTGWQLGTGAARASASRAAAAAAARDGQASSSDAVAQAGLSAVDRQTFAQQADDDERLTQTLSLSTSSLSSPLPAGRQGDESDSTPPAAAVAAAEASDGVPTTPVGMDSGPAAGRQDSCTTVSRSTSAVETRSLQLQRMKLDKDLRPLCKQYGLPVSGRKADLVARILQHEGLQVA